MTTLAATILCITFMDPRVLKETVSLPPETPRSWREALQGDGISIANGQNQGIAFHMVRSVRVSAESEQLANGLTPECLGIGCLLGIVSFDKAWTDFRGQSIPPGRYALRYGLQPVSDDHADTAPGRHFGLLVPMGAEPGPIPSQETLFKQSVAVTGKHPAVMPLLGGRKNSGRVVQKLDGDCWAVPLDIPAATESMQAILPLRLIIAGKSPATQP